MSSVSLMKGQKVDLTKGGETLNKITVGLGWSSAQYGQTLDLDASAYLLGSSGKVTSDNDFIFYNKLISDCRSIVHMGDDLEGGSAHEDDEQIIVELDKIVDKYSAIAFTVSIHDYEIKNQNFGQIKNAFIRIVNADTGNEILRYNLAEDFSSETALIFCELYRVDGKWKFSAVGKGFNGGLYTLCQHFGVNV